MPKITAQDYDGLAQKALANDIAGVLEVYRRMDLSETADIILFCYSCYAGVHQNANLLPYIFGDDYIAKIAPYFMGQESSIPSEEEYKLDQNKAEELCHKIRRANSLSKIYDYLEKRLQKYLGKHPVSLERFRNRTDDSWARVMDFFQLLRIIRDYPENRQSIIKQHLQLTREKFTSGKISNEYSDLREILYYLNEDDLTNALLSFETYRANARPYNTLEWMYHFHYFMENSFATMNPMLIPHIETNIFNRQKLGLLVKMAVGKQQQEFLAAISSNEFPSKLLADFSREYHTVSGYEKATLFGLVLENFEPDVFLVLFQRCQPHVSLYGENGLLALYHITMTTPENMHADSFSLLLLLIAKKFPADAFCEFINNMPADVTQDSKDDFLAQTIFSLYMKIENALTPQTHRYWKKENSSSFRNLFFGILLPALPLELTKKVLSHENAQKAFSDFNSLTLMPVKDPVKILTGFLGVHNYEKTPLSLPVILARDASEETLNTWLDYVASDPAILAGFRQWALSGCQNFAEYADENYKDNPALHAPIIDRQICLTLLASRYSFTTFKRFFSLLAEDGISFDQGLTPWGNVLRFDHQFYSALDTNPHFSVDEKKIVTDKLHIASLLPKYFHRLLTYTGKEYIQFKGGQEFLLERSSSYSNRTVSRLTFFLLVLYSFTKKTLPPELLYLTARELNYIGFTDTNMADLFVDYFLNQFLPSFLKAITTPVEIEIDREYHAMYGGFSCDILSTQRKVAIDFATLVLAEMELMATSSYKIDYSIVRSYFRTVPEQIFPFMQSMNAQNPWFALHREILDSIKRLNGKGTQKTFISWWAELLTVLRNPAYFDPCFPSPKEQLTRMEKLLSNIPREHILSVSYFDARRDLFKTLAVFCAKQTSSREFELYLSYLAQRKHQSDLPVYEQKLLHAFIPEANVLAPIPNAARARMSVA